MDHTVSSKARLFAISLSWNTSLSSLGRKRDRSYNKKVGTCPKSSIYFLCATSDLYIFFKCIYGFAQRSIPESLLDSIAISSVDLARFWSKCWWPFTSVRLAQAILRGGISKRSQNSGQQPNISYTRKTRYFFFFFFFSKIFFGDISKWDKTFWTNGSKFTPFQVYAKWLCCSLSSSYIFQPIVCFWRACSSRPRIWLSRTLYADSLFKGCIFNFASPTILFLVFPCAF